MHRLSFEAQRPHIAILSEHRAGCRWCVTRRDGNRDRLLTQDTRLVHPVNSARDNAVIAEGIYLNKPIDNFFRLAWPSTNLLFEYTQKLKPVRFSFLQLVIVRITKSEIGGEVQPA